MLQVDIWISCPDTLYLAQIKNHIWNSEKVLEHAFKYSPYQKIEQLSKSLFSFSFSFDFQKQLSFFPWPAVPEGVPIDHQNLANNNPGYPNGK